MEQKWDECDNPIKIKKNKNRSSISSKLILNDEIKNKYKNNNSSPP